MLFITGCRSNKEAETEKFQKHRNKIIHVGNKIVDIKTDVLFGLSFLNIIDNFLIVNEGSPRGYKGIHLFDKNSFGYITSTGFTGRGPGEISVPGRIGVDDKNRVFWIPSHGKKIMYKFSLDSVLNNEKYKPTEKLDLD